MSIRLQTAALAAGTLLLIGSGAASAQTDPGVRASLQSAPGAVDHRHERQGEAHSFHSAFPEQAKIITDALMQWRFKPYSMNGQPMEVETGTLFGHVSQPAELAGRQ